MAEIGIAAHLGSAEIIDDIIPTKFTHGLIDALYYSSGVVEIEIDKLDTRVGETVAASRLPDSCPHLISTMERLPHEVSTQETAGTHHQHTLGLRRGQLCYFPYLLHNRDLL